MSFFPLLNRVIVEIPKEEESRVVNGLILPPTETKRYLTGKVLATGPGKYSTDGSLLPMHVRPGMTVTFDKGAGRDLHSLDKGVDHRVMFEDEIWGYKVD